MGEEGDRGRPAEDEHTDPNVHQQHPSVPPSSQEPYLFSVGLPYPISGAGHHYNTREIQPV